jgi:succinoglycan biosynthesis transport protein ExoP
MNPLPLGEGSEATQGPPALPARNPLQIAWQRKPLVALGVLAGVAVAAIFASQKAPIYQSTAQVLVVKKHADAALPMPGGGNPSVGYYDDYVSTHLALIRSQVVIDKAVKKRDLGSLPSLSGRGNPTPAIIAALAAARDTKESGATNIVNLSYRGPVAEDCRVILNAVVESYKDFLDETYRNVSDDTLGLINKARDLLEKDLVEKEKKFAEFREKAVLAVPAKEGPVAAPTRLGEQEVKRLLIKKADIDERLKALAEAKTQEEARELVQALTTPAAEKAVAQDGFDHELTLLELEKRVLRQQYGEDHPRLLELREKIEFLTAEKNAARVGGGGPADRDPVETYVKALQRERVAVELTLKSLGVLVADEQKEARDQARFEIQEALLRADIARTQQVYDQTISRLKEINLVRDFGGYDAKMISTPAPGGPTGTGSVQLLLAGAAVGLLAGVGLAYLSDVTDKSFRNPEEIRRRLGLPIVAHVPIMDDKDALSSPDAPQLEQSLAAYHRPKSGEAEAYRSLRTALYFSTRGKGHKVIQVTSPTMGDGKTTMASNLAIAIAQAGKRVVLVDADMRRPRVHAMFGVRPEHGLSSVIAGEAPLQATLVDSGIERLTLLTCGPRPENPAELLSQPQFELVLDELRQQFDFVIVDTPPLLAVTDPAIVVSRMDGVLLTVRVSKNGRPAAERAREILYSVHANVLGIVVNGVGKSNGTYGYDHYRYGYEYGYGGEYVSTTAETNGHVGTNGAHATNGTNGTVVKRKKRSSKKTAGWFGRLFQL